MVLAAQVKTASWDLDIPDHLDDFMVTLPEPKVRY
jgi:hypothetical protein